jgi:hypothetical protein
MQKFSFSKIVPKGSVLVFSLLILSIMLVTSLTILSSAVMNQKASLSTGSSTRSFQVADSGVEEVLYQIHKNASAHRNLGQLATAIGGNCDMATGKVSFPIAGGTAVVSFYQEENMLYADKCVGPDDDWRDKVVKIKSEGTAGSTTRAVEVAVASGAVPGITGGCAITNDSPDGIRDGWGSGCQPDNTPISLGIIGSHSASSVCFNASASGFECGAVGVREALSGGVEDLFCQCTKQ